AQLNDRLARWATLARPDAAQTRVASLLGVSPVADPGQPTRLALSQPTAPVETAVAEAAPVDVAMPAAPVRLAAIPAPAAPAPDQVSDWGLPAPVQTAAAEPVPVPALAPVVAEAPTYYTSAPAAPERAPSPAEVEYAFAARTLTRPGPAVVRTAAASLPPA